MVQGLTSQVEDETDSVALLPKVVGLLFVQVNISFQFFILVINFHFRLFLCYLLFLQCNYEDNDDNNYYHQHHHHHYHNQYTVTGYDPPELPQVHSRALQAPGRVMLAVIMRLKVGIPQFFVLCGLFRAIHDHLLRFSW